MPARSPVPEHAGRVILVVPTRNYAFSTASTPRQNLVISLFDPVQRVVFRLTWATLSCLSSAAIVAADLSAQTPPPASTLESAPASIAEIDGWVQELSSNSYLLRKRATTNLTRVGEPAVDQLVAQLSSGDLEVTERVLGILQEIASRAPVLPNRAAGFNGGETAGNGDYAWNELLRIAKLGGSQGTRAKVATDEIRDVRRGQALELLGAAGVFIGITDFTFGSIIEQRRIVEVDERFEGDAAVISLLQWIDGIDYARVNGTAIRKEVLAGIVQMPNLKTLVLREGDITANELALLGGMSELRRLELRYIPMTGELIDQLAQLPIRVSLTLNGTNAPADRVAKLQKSVPGLEIIFKKGGFLGVQCNSTPSECLVSVVVPGKGADQAGLLPGDVVVDIDGVTIKKFKDLQDEIDKHPPGDEIKIRYQRGGILMETTAKLGKLELP